MSSTLIAPSQVWTGLELLRDSERSKAAESTGVVKLVHHMAVIVLIVAIAVVLIAGIVAFSLIAYQCILHGYHTVKSYGPDGWQVWNFRIVCKK